MPPDLIESAVCDFLLNTWEHCAGEAEAVAALADRTGDPVLAAWIVRAWTGQPGRVRVILENPANHEMFECWVRAVIGGPVPPAPSNN